MYRLLRARIRFGRYVFRARNHLFPVVAIGLLCLFPPRPEESSEALDLALHAAGILLVLAGALLRAATVGLVYVPRSGSGKRIHAQALFTHGLFAHCRNPLYLGNLLIVLGLLVNHNNPWAYLFVGGFFLLAYGALVAAEEAYLRKRFGRDYRDYCRRVPRWRLRLTGLAETVRYGGFDGRRVLWIEYASIALWVAMLLADLGADAVVEYGVEASRGDLAVLGAIAAAAGCVALWIRILKRTGRLVRPG